MFHKNAFAVHKTGASLEGYRLADFMIQFVLQLHSAIKLQHIRSRKSCCWLKNQGLGRNAQCGTVNALIFLSLGLTKPVP
jgi:hypothetical protein